MLLRRTKAGLSQQQDGSSVSVSFDEPAGGDAAWDQKTITELLAEEDAEEQERLISEENDKGKGKEKEKEQEYPGAIVHLDAENTVSTVNTRKRKRKNNALALPPRKVETVPLEFNQVLGLRYLIMSAYCYLLQNEAEFYNSLKAKSMRKVQMTV